MLVPTHYNLCFVSMGENSTQDNPMHTRLHLSGSKEDRHTKLSSVQDKMVP